MFKEILKGNLCKLPAVSEYIAPTADVSNEATIGADTMIWHLAQVREQAQIGNNCIIGRGAYIDHAVEVGANSKIQNYALVYAPAKLGVGVFIGPAAVLTNDMFPRAATPELDLKGTDDWDPQGTTVGDGAAIGARAVIVPGITIGRWAMVAAGAVVTRDVPDFALMVGVPAKRVGWVGKSGKKCVEIEDGFLDPDTRERYEEIDGLLKEV